MDTRDKVENDRLQNAADGIRGHVEAQLRAGHYRPNELADILARVHDQLSEDHRVDTRQQQQHQQQ